MIQCIGWRQEPDYMDWTECTPLVLLILDNLTFLKPTTPQSPLRFCPIPVNDATPDFIGTMRGFPSGCFRIRAADTQTYWIARWGETHQDGNGIDLWQFMGENVHGHVCESSRRLLFMNKKS